MTQQQASQQHSPQRYRTTRPGPPARLNPTQQQTSARARALALPPIRMSSDGRLFPWSAGLGALGDLGADLGDLGAFGRARRRRPSPCQPLPEHTYARTHAPTNTRTPKPDPGCDSDEERGTLRGYVPRHMPVSNMLCVCWGFWFGGVCVVLCWDRALGPSVSLG